MTACRQCNSTYADPVPRFCGRCGADLRLASGPGSPGVEGDGSTALALDDAPGPGMDPLLGRVIAGRYRVLERIGAGGMGIVYRVEHTAIGKIAALKMLHPTLTMERDLVKRFRTEARAVSLLTHPNTVQVFDFGEADGALFMVMELVRGDDLATVLEREGALTWKRTAPLLIQMCEALGEAHEAGIIHRDIKPENVLVCRTRDGKESVKVLDFGLAKLRERPEMANITGRGMLIGTPYYMAPEQIEGDEPDARSDIYALGALAYRVLTAKYPFDGPKPVAVLTAHLTEPYRPMSHRRTDLKFAPAIEAVVAKCLARNPKERFASADELKLAIERAVEVTSGHSLPSVPAVMKSEPSGRVGLLAKAPPGLSREDLDRFEESLRRGRLRLLVLLVMLAGAMGLGAYSLLPKGDRPVTTEVEPNNGAGEANPIASGVTVRGQIGKRLSLEASDRDFYRFHVDRGPVLLRLEVTGLPNMDLILGVYNSLSDKVAESDNGGPGDGESIPNLRLEAGDYYVSVREVWVSGQMATENVTDWYQLTATWARLGPGLESEPNDTPAEAMSVTPGEQITGYLGRAADVDYFYPRGEPGGELEGHVSGVAGVDVKIVVLPPRSTVATGASDPSALKGARVFDAGGAGAPESFAKIPWPEGGAAPLIVVMRKDRESRSAGQAYRPATHGVTVPYSLLIARSSGAQPTSTQHEGAGMVPSSLVPAVMGGVVGPTGDAGAVEIAPSGAVPQAVGAVQQNVDAVQQADAAVQQGAGAAPQATAEVDAGVGTASTGNAGGSHEGSHRSHSLPRALPPPPALTPEPAAEKMPSPEPTAAPVEKAAAPSPAKDSAADKPAATEKAADKQPATEKAVAAEKPPAEKRVEKTAAEKSAPEKAAAEKPTAEKRSDGENAAPSAPKPTPPVEAAPKKPEEAPVAP